MNANSNGRAGSNGTAGFAGIPDEATLARLVNELFSALPAEPGNHNGRPGTAAGHPETVTRPPETVAGQPAAASFPAGDGLAAAAEPALTDLPGALGDPGITLHVPARRETASGWDLSLHPSPRRPEFYFLSPESELRDTSASGTRQGGHPFDVDALRRDFPILTERVNGHQLVWLDNAATTQKPQEVIDRLSRFYAQENSNVHRGAHELAARATDAYEDARAAVASFLGAPSSEDIVFVRGATEAINLVAQSWGRRYVGAGDEIVISCLEHHANIVPWQLLAEERGATLRVIPVDDSGQILLDEYRALLTERTRLVSVAHVSNALGTITPVREVIRAAHDAGARVLVDGAQAVAHLPVDVRELDADFYVFSGHKVFGPTGIGALYGKADVLDSMPPWQGGGNMIRNVTFERTAYEPPPARFEAGTAPIGDAAGLGAALAYVERIGRGDISAYEDELLGYATLALTAVPGLRLIGTAPDKAGILSFVLDGDRPEDVGSALNQQGIAVRAGHHCAEPILRRFGLTATVGAALAMYNTRAEIDLLAAALHRLTAQRRR